MIVAASLQVKSDPLFKKSTLMILIERTLSSRVAKDFDIQIMKRALLVFGMASITLSASFAQQSSGNSAGGGGTGSPTGSKADSVHSS